MLDAEPVVRGRHLLEGGFERVQHHAVRPVAYRVHVHLEPVAQGALRDLLHAVPSSDHEAGVAGVIRVRLQQRGAPTSQGAVGHQLDCADPEPSVVQAFLGAAVEEAIQEVVQRAVRGGDHHVVAQVVTALAREILIHRDGRVAHAGVVHAGESPLVCFGDRREDCFATFALRHRRDDTPHHPLCPVDQHAGGVALVVTDEPSAVGVGCRRRHAGQLERPGVHDGSVPVHPGDVHRMVRHGARQRLVRRELRHRPVVLVPPAAANPLALRHGPGSLDDTLDHLIVRAGAHEVDDAPRGAEAEQVGVRVHHSRNDGLAVEVELLGARTREDLGATCAADEDHAAVANRHGCGDRPVVVHRVDAGVGDDQVGRLLGCECRRDGEGKQGQQRALHESLIT